ncbi:hypothetical protein HanXRQr2_Chr01g0043501 [Helianthus annuus]|uniref:Uncharacterized protein n=1 Tax=Helianthus annuus TaxID=4232 RepID=A0A251VS59_HELAN|nr:hypothetical protein HanXRQr2_Chr01g0043501 [Helianthus annuus]KAJ0958815.1 hypothetical protein HanPSC8_Chr01g0043041 [Helianthus annuus]
MAMGNHVYDRLPTKITAITDKHSANKAPTTFNIERTSKGRGYVIHLRGSWWRRITKTDGFDTRFL